MLNKPTLFRLRGFASRWYNDAGDSQETRLVPKILNGDVVAISLAANNGVGATATVNAKVRQQSVAALAQTAVVSASIPFVLPSGAITANDGVTGLTADDGVTPLTTGAAVTESASLSANNEQQGVVVAVAKKTASFAANTAITSATTATSRRRTSTVANSEYGATAVATGKHYSSIVAGTGHSSSVTVSVKRAAIVVVNTAQTSNVAASARVSESLVARTEHGAALSVGRIQRTSVVAGCGQSSAINASGLHVVSLVGRNEQSATALGSRHQGASFGASQGMAATVNGGAKLPIALTANNGQSASVVASIQSTTQALLTANDGVTPLTANDGATFLTNGGAATFSVSFAAGISQNMAGVSRARYSAAIGANNEQTATAVVAVKRPVSVIANNGATLGGFVGARYVDGIVVGCGQASSVNVIKKQRVAGALASGHAFLMTGYAHHITSAASKTSMSVVVNAQTSTAETFAISLTAFTGHAVGVAATNKAKASGLLFTGSAVTLTGARRSYVGAIARHDQSATVSYGRLRAVGGGLATGTGGAVVTVARARASGLFSVGMASLVNGRRRAFTRVDTFIEQSANISPMRVGLISFGATNEYALVGAAKDRKGAAFSARLDYSAILSAVVSGGSLNTAPVLRRFVQYVIDGTSEENLKGIIYAYYMPPMVTEGVALLNAVENIEEINYNNPPYEKGGFQLVVRHGEYVKGWELCGKIARLLTIQESTRAYGMYIHYLYPVTDVVVFPRLKSGYFEFLVECEYCVVR